jgi:hypothetical protein
MRIPLLGGGFYLALALAALATPALAAVGDGGILFEPATQIPAQGGPGAKLAFLPGGVAFLDGGVGSITLKDGIGLGLGGYSLVSEYVPIHDGIKSDLGYSYGGLLLNYSFYIHELFYVNASVMAGPAQGWSVPRQNGAERAYVNFAQIEPEVDFMLNVTHELRVGLGLSWRLCSGADLDSILGTNLDGGAASFVMMYGKI